MAINLKNYTTEVPASRSIENIEKLLVGAGATNIMKEYGPAGKCKAVSFLISCNNMSLPFRLPAKVDRVYSWLKRQKPKSSEKLLQEQSERIAWKIQHEWVHIQLSLIELEQAEILELFFPLLYDIQSKETYFERIKLDGFKALLPV